uniref:Uncharacterized protein n=1 Tax=Mimiviridae sp. ChoanoV1 TaxID=2596887 RepID=A0A5B8HXR9_9VIRU|nr:hypothetical protein 2_92 [Mimiviridae sp. ChoanoV1]
MRLFHTNNQILLDRINNLNQKITNSDIIHKSINNSNRLNNGNRLNNNNRLNSSNLVNIEIPNWENKVNNHMNYKNGNPLMYPEKQKELYNDL